MSLQKIKVMPPPNFERILARFPDADRPGVIFSYGSVIYNPSNVSIPREVMVHEATHGLRQEAQGVELWWKRYLAEPLFCLDEEIYAHHSEYRAAIKRHGPRPRDLRRIAERLSGPLYGNLLTFEQAKHAILTGEVR